MHVEAPAVHEVALSLIEGFGPRRRRDLLARFGSAGAILEARRSELLGVPGVGPALANSIASADLKAAVEHLDRVRALGGAVLTPRSEGFPPLLREIPDPPFVLYARGEVGLLTEPCVAIVGSRRHTSYGARVTERVAGGAAAGGLTVVSGLARGIDAIAHRAALKAGGGSIGVLGTGIDIVYPAENRQLFEQMSKQGCLVSELPPGARPKPGGFQARNRLISGLAPVLVVIEAGRRSGTSITAGCAADQGREVIAVPGPIIGSASWGTNRLIRDGAKPLLDMDDLWEEYPGLVTKRREVRASPREPLEGSEEAVWDALDGMPQHVDDLAERAGLSAASVLSTLVTLELKGLVRSEPGKQFARAE